MRVVFTTSSSRLLITMLFVAAVCSLDCATPKESGPSLTGTVFFRTSSGETRRQGGIRVALVSPADAFSSHWSNVVNAIERLEAEKYALVRSGQATNVISGEMAKISGEIQEFERDIEYMKTRIHDLRVKYKREDLAQDEELRMEKVLREKEGLERELAAHSRRREESRAQGSKQDAVRGAAAAQLEQQKGSLEDFVVASSRMGITNADGAFVFDAVDPGTYVVLAVARLGDDVAAWMREVQVADGQQTCDLFNDQCTILVNDLAEPLQAALQRAGS